MNKIKLENTILFALILISFSCNSKKSFIQNNSLNEINPKLIFLNYSISESINGKKKINFINKIVTDGKLKNKTTYKNKEVGDLICNQVDKNSNILQSIIIKNPLIKNFEYINDSKEFQRKKVKLDNAEFSLKLKLESNTKHIIINEITHFEKKPTLLIKTKVD